MAGVQEAFNSVSVVIPAYNAQDVICDTLDAVQAYLSRNELASEVIVVDDGSTDRTAVRIEERDCGVRLLRNDRNRGKGAAVRAGMLEATCAWAVFMDADNSTRIEHLDRFALNVADADVCIGSRLIDGAHIVHLQTASRRLLGRLFSRLRRAMVLPHLHDTQCGFKAIRREVIRPVFSQQRCDGFCFDVEVLLIASRLGLRIVEIPIEWNNPDESTVHAWRHGTRMLFDLLGIAWRSRTT